MLDEDLRPWLLEVNESPNLRDHGAETLEPMLDALLDIVLGDGVDVSAREEEPRGPERESHESMTQGYTQRGTWRPVSVCK